MSTPGDTNEGWLLNWNNIINGYQARWFVLSDGLLSYYRSEEKHRCQGTINLATANIKVKDLCNFVISNNEAQTNDGAQTYNLKAISEAEGRRWITALKLAKDKAIHMQAKSGIQSKALAAGLLAAVTGGVGAVLLAPVALGVVGFTAGGIAAGSTAASMMSAAAVANGGGVAAGSLVACLQSAAAVGLSGTATAVVSGVGAAVGGAAVGAVRWFSKIKRS